MKLVSVIGVRPQFVKEVVIQYEINKKNDISEVVIHTGLMPARTEVIPLILVQLQVEFSAMLYHRFIHTSLKLYHNQIFI